MGQTMQIVCRAIKRVNNPTAGWVSACNLATFFAQETIIGACAHQFLAQNFLRGPIRTAYEIARPF